MRNFGIDPEKLYRSSDLHVPVMPVRPMLLLHYGPRFFSTLL